LPIKIPFGIVRAIEKSSGGENMKTIGVIGFKKSGKTTLTKSIAKSLIDRGYSVAVIKHSNKPVDHGNTDTGQFTKAVSQVALITPENTEIILQGDHNLSEIMSYINADYLLVEGFKNIKYFPKILCLKKEDNRQILDDGLVLFTVGLETSLKEQENVDYLLSEKKDLEEIVKQVENRAFMLPNMNCGKCGYGNCYNLAQAIVKGMDSQKKCVYFKNLISININKKRIYLNPFMSKLYQNMLYGMFSPLKDIGSLQNAKIEIELGFQNKSENVK
jgi:molybdopterin-guanine dinucleotide biosynthesis adapter protein